MHTYDRLGVFLELLSLTPLGNNLDYLKLCIDSLHKNSHYKNEILVHINQGTDGTIDFLKEKNSFQKHWMTYLKLVEELAFEELNLHKIYTYAFDLRQHLYPVLAASGFREEARLKEHCYFNGSYFDVVINSKINEYA